MKIPITVDINDKNFYYLLLLSIYFKVNFPYLFFLYKKFGNDLFYFFFLFSGRRISFPKHNKLNEVAGSCERIKKSVMDGFNTDDLTEAEKRVVSRIIEEFYIPDDKKLMVIVDDEI